MTQDLDKQRQKSASAPVTASSVAGSPAEASMPLVFKADPGQSSGPVGAPVVGVLGFLMLLALMVWMKTGSRRPVWPWRMHEVRPQRALWIESRQALAPGTQLQVVRYQKRRLLLAVHAQGVSVLRDDEIEADVPLKENPDVR